MSRYYDSHWAPYVSVAERRRRAADKLAKLKKAGQSLSPVDIEGRKITQTFWGDAWCKNLEAYGDYANRLPRGRTYVRNGSVIDLQIEAGQVRTLVNGTQLYRAEVKIKSLAAHKWTTIKAKCAGQIGSLVELLDGSLSKNVMDIVTSGADGLFPAPDEITLHCSCPDWASMCKHVAATLYGVGARLDREPELLFTLRGVDPTQLVAAAIDHPKGTSRPRRGRGLRSDELSAVFGIDIDVTPVSTDESAGSARSTRTTRRAAKTQRPAPTKIGSKKTSGKRAVSKKTSETQTHNRVAPKKAKVATPAQTRSTAKKTSAVSTMGATRGGARKTTGKKR